MSEREAIKSLKEFAYTIHGTLSAEEAKIVLNLIEKQQKELEEEKEANNETICQLIDEKEKLEEENRIFALEGKNIKLEIYIKDNYIKKSKIKDKIEELESDNSKFENYTFEKLTSRDIRRTIITNLQELLEKEG